MRAAFQEQEGEGDMTKEEHVSARAGAGGGGQRGRQVALDAEGAPRRVLIGCLSSLVGKMASCDGWEVGQRGL